MFSGPYLATLNGRTYDVSTDGKKFLMIKTGETGTTTQPLGKIVIVQNWLENLKR
jgi:hypothetical protein